MLFELNHFPDQNSQKYENIHRLFQLIFRSGNEIYSWGKMQVELEQAKHLFTWPIPATLNDIQPHFPAWYNWARTQCGVQGLSHCNDVNNDNKIIQQHHQALSCLCHPSSPYGINELWSLQKAFMYGCKLYIDKSCTLGYWTSSLTSSHSSLSHEEQMKMVHYATHDAMAVTYLIRPITEKWTFKQLEERKISEMFITFNAIKLPLLPATTSTKKKNKNINIQKLSKIFKCTDSDIESISSDEEIYLNRLVGPVMNDYHLEDPVKNDDITYDVIQNLGAGGDELQNEIPTADVIMNDIINDDGVESVNNHIVVVNEVDNPPEEQQQQQRIKKRRSSQAKQKKNRKRNNQLRSTRYRYCLTRPFYYKFKSRTLRKLLRQHGVEFRHIKKVQDRVVIGVKTDEARRDYERTLPSNCFNKNNYERCGR
jgi:hypothetical protein